MYNQKMDSKGNASQSGREPYEVECHACGKPFNAARAPWCSCLTNLRTLVCPACGACFCAAPKGYRDRFWAQAPQDLSRRRFEEKTAPFEPLQISSPGELRRPIVLVADDERVILRLATKVLGGLGYSVLTAKDGAEALKVAQAVRPDLVLTDALMPRMDGREVCKRLKSDPRTSSIKVIIMTSTYTASRYKTEAMAAYRADGYLNKPVDFKVLKELLRQQLS